MTDRGLWVAGLSVDGNVRRLMYQSLIWPFDLGNEARSLRTPLDAEDGERLADSLVDRVGGNLELGSDLFRRQELID